MVQRQDLDIPDLIRKYEIGMMTYGEIAKEIGLNVASVFEVMKLYGVKSRRNIKRNQYGANNASWVGNNARSIATYHQRLDRAKGKPHYCDFCHTTTAIKYDWANMTDNYDDPTDYKRLCRSCHLKYDYKRKREGTLWNNRFKDLAEKDNSYIKVSER